MFTGIVEEIGRVEIFQKSMNAELKVSCKTVLEDTQIGDSIAINGVCQTVTELGKDYFCVQVSNETLNVTTFSSLKNGEEVNLERAMTPSSRLGGHIVTGHVDTVAKLVNKVEHGEFCNLTFSADKEYQKYIAKKGSVAINGVSLTVADTYGDNFTIAVIPHTLQNTTLKSLKISGYVNLELDILSKYVENFLSRNNNKVIDENFLKENGF